jgi:hypothetical protein
MIRKLALTTFFALCLAVPATANDSVASMGTGGLILQRTDGIVMQSEELFVSAREIRVKYRFFNRTDQDITTIVAFPLPDLVGGSEAAIALSDPGTLTFTTTVAGQRVATEIEQKAMLAKPITPACCESCPCPCRPTTGTSATPSPPCPDPGSSSWSRWA